MKESTPCITRFYNSRYWDSFQCFLTLEVLVSWANSLRPGQKLAVFFGYCEARLNEHSEITETTEADLDDLCHSIIGQASGNKETLVFAENNNGRIQWLLISYYDYRVRIADNPNALLLCREGRYVLSQEGKY